MTCELAASLRIGDIVVNYRLSSSYDDRLTVTQPGYHRAYGTPCIEVCDAQHRFVDSLVDLTELICRRYPDHITLPEGI